MATLDVRAWYERAAHQERAWYERACPSCVPRGGIMAPHAASAMPLPLEPGPEPGPAGPRLTLAEPPAAAQRDRVRPLEVAQCTMCGIALPLGLLIADGGQACANIRWYCKDAKSCTERWTAAR